MMRLLILPSHTPAGNNLGTFSCDMTRKLLAYCQFCVCNCAHIGVEHARSNNFIMAQY
jgi:hypothetical protein